MLRLSSWTAALLLVIASLVPGHRASAQGYVIVANEAGPAAISKAELSRIFLRKSTKLTAVDQDRDAAVRSAFSRAVIGRPVSAIISHWQQQIFSGGDNPPTEKSSDAEVLAFVRSTPNGIGYVASTTDLGAGVRAVTLR